VKTSKKYILPIRKTSPITGRLSFSEINTQGKCYYVGSHPV